MAIMGRDIMIGGEMIAGVRGVTLLITMIIVAMPSICQGRNRCYNCYAPAYYTPAYNNDKVNVINRIEHLYATGPIEDQATADALQKQWDNIASALPIQPSKSPFKTFAFRQNVENAAPQRATQAQAVQTAAVSKIYTGYIRHSVFIKTDGSVAFTQETPQPDPPVATAPPTPIFIHH